MNPKCDKCNGACCKTLVVPCPTPADKEWIKGRAFWMNESIAIVSSRCRHLNERGLCGIYEARPQVCRDFKVGCVECRVAIVATQ